MNESYALFAACVAVRAADDALRVAIAAFVAARDALEVAQATDEAAFEAYLVVARAAEAEAYVVGPLDGSTRGTTAFAVRRRK